MRRVLLSSCSCLPSLGVPEQNLSQERRMLVLMSLRSPIGIARGRVVPSLGCRRYSRDAQVEHVEEDAVCNHVDDVANDPAQHQRPHDHLQRDGGYGAFTKASGERSKGLHQPHARQLSQPKTKLPMTLPAWETSVLEVNP